MEEFKETDKNALIQLEGNKILEQFANGAVLQDPSCLARFAVLSFAVSGEVGRIFLKFLSCNQRVEILMSVILLYRISSATPTTIGLPFPVP